MCFEGRKRIGNDGFFLEGGKEKYKTSTGYQAAPH